MPETIKIETTREFLFEACALVYSRWTREYDSLKAVKSEKNDGSKDWNLFHAERLRRHTVEEKKWAHLKDEAVRCAANLRVP